MMPKSFNGEVNNQLKSVTSCWYDNLPESWESAIASFRDSEAGQGLIRRLHERMDSGAVIYPSDPWCALRLVDPHQIKLVILGQDPYHGPGQAMGLAFSVPPAIKMPPSLKNIFVEYQRDMQKDAPKHGDLTHWARQGVLLLNTALTVEDGQPGSHQKIGWHPFTDQLIQQVVDSNSPKVFMLWGAHAQAKAALIPPHHLVLMANHPSPLSARRPPVPFIGCGHFSQAKDFLTQHQLTWPELSLEAS